MDIKLGPDLQVNPGFSSWTGPVKIKSRDEQKPGKPD